MDENSGTKPNIEDMELAQITELSVGDLYSLVKGVSPAKLLRMGTDYCFVKAISEHPENVVKAEVRAEFLKEWGRDNRALIKNFDGDGDSEDRGPFPR